MSSLLCVGISCSKGGGCKDRVGRGGGVGGGGHIVEEKSDILKIFGHTHLHSLALCVCACACAYVCFGEIDVERNVDRDKDKDKDTDRIGEIFNRLKRERKIRKIARTRKHEGKRPAGEEGGGSRGGRGHLVVIVDPTINHVCEFFQVY